MRQRQLNNSLAQLAHEVCDNDPGVHVVVAHESPNRLVLWRTAPRAGPVWASGVVAIVEQAIPGGELTVRGASAHQVASAREAARLLQFEPGSLH
jgi:hypothetical protein